MKKLAWVLSLIPVLSYSQKYVAEAPLPPVQDKAFYNIPLSPGITSLLDAGFGNVRIIDEKGQEVPYILQADKPEFSNVRFIEYAMKKDQKKGCCTTLTLINQQRNSISNIILEVKNAETIKTATLTGSDDQQSWYALKEHFTLGGFNNSGQTSQLSILDFPLSNYGWYQVVINDSTTAPLNIVKAGYYDVSTDYGVYMELPDVNVIPMDTALDQSSWFAISFDTTQFIDKLEFEVEGPQFYNRSATLNVKESYMVKKVKKEYFNSIYDFNLVSTQQASASLSTKVSGLYLSIHNGNNPPLTIKSVKAWQLKRALTAWLEPGRTYKVAVGNDLRTPDYDLPFFRDSIPAKPAVLQSGTVTLFAKPSAASTPTLFTNRNIIWVAIILVAAILGTMSVRMLREKDDAGKI